MLMTSEEAVLILKLVTSSYISDLMNSDLRNEGSNEMKWDGGLPVSGFFCNG
jgi:hypothetical protein